MTDEIQTLRSELESARIELAVERLCSPLSGELVDNPSAHVGFRKEVRSRLGVDSNGQVRALFGDMPVEDAERAVNDVKKAYPFFFKSAHATRGGNESETKSGNNPEAKPENEAAYHRQRLAELAQQATRDPQLSKRYITARMLVHAGRYKDLNWNRLLADTATRVKGAVR